MALLPPLAQGNFVVRQLEARHGLAQLLRHVGERLDRLRGLFGACRGAAGYALHHAHGLIDRTGLAGLLLEALRDRYAPDVIGLQEDELFFAFEEAAEQFPATIQALV